VDIPPPGYLDFAAAVQRWLDSQIETVAVREPVLVERINHPADVVSAVVRRLAVVKASSTVAAAVALGSDLDLVRLQLTTLIVTSSLVVVAGYLIERGTLYS
jgi:hypothetical protein